MPAARRSTDQLEIQPHGMKRLALLLISFYQRHLSPRKGYCCAYRTLHGGSSCSHFGFRAIGRCGIFMGVLLLRRRFTKCSAAFQALPPRQSNLRGLQLQRGHCDLPVGDCHPGHAGGEGWVSESLNCLPCDSSCDFRAWRRRKRPRQGEVTFHPDL